MTRTLIKGGCVLSMSQVTGNHREADVLIDGETITEIGPSLRARDATVVDAGDTIVMPGFVDAHRHVWESLFRGLGDVPGITDPADRYASRYSADDLYAATLIGLLGAAEAGISTVVDWCEVNTDDAHTDAALSAHADSRLRTVFAFAGWDDDPGGWQSGLRRLAATPSAPNVTFAAGLGESGEPRSENWAVAREFGLRIHAHCGTSDSGRGLASHDLLGAEITLVHGSHLADDDLDSIASTKTAMVLTPCSELARGVPTLSIQRLVDRGIRPGLGIDTERVAPGDLFAQIRATISLQHATHFESKLAGKAGLPKLLTTREVIRYATIDGARAVGLGEVTGSLEVGKQADIVVLRTDRPNIFPINDPIGAVVWGMDTSNVDWVFVAGNAVVREGAVVADIDRVRKLAMTARQQVAGPSSNLVGSR
jgi:5-methylthioadenosine/S-adenosylhomocysteine deaminase